MIALALALSLTAEDAVLDLLPPHRPGASAAPEGSGAALLRQAKALRYAQRWYEAAQLYRRYLDEHPQSGRVPEARFWLAAALESDQRWDEAAQAYTVFLAAHPDQRLLGKEAKLNRIRCWGIRQHQNPSFQAGLVEALGAELLEVRVAAGLQLAKAGDRRAVEALKAGLALPSSADACTTALVALGVKPSQVAVPAQGRFLVIRVKEPGKPDAVTIRLALGLARAASNYLSDAQLRQAQAKGFDLGGITEKAAAMPRGSVLLSVDDGKSSVTITVE